MRLMTVCLWAGLTACSARTAPPLGPDTSGRVAQQRSQTLRQAEHPEDHTARFRVAHGEAAASADAKCGDCHTGLSADPRQRCQDCHALLLPRDHTLRWQGVSHGRAAAREPRRCATCHEVDTCTECHSVPPRNHSPLQRFRIKHDRAARLNPRACVTCHTFESTCAECHALDAFPFR